MHYANCMTKELMRNEVIHGLLLNPYKKRRPQISKFERTKILQVLQVIQHAAMMSDFAYLCGVYMFDKVMEGLSLASLNHHNLQ